MNASHGVFALLKPPGMTSHDAVAHVRRVTGVKRVGHTGTLDPAASGVLPICVGQATRLVEALQSGTKEYLAEATFGFETDTLDAVGEVTRRCAAEDIDRASLERACVAFRGEIEQEPPLHSAIKVGGQKLYDVARAGKEIEIPRRRVTISALEITRFYPGPQPRALLRIECSGGTYIRSLVRDVGRATGSAATMTFLSRIRSGHFELPAALTPQEFESEPLLTPLYEVLKSLYGSPNIDDKAALALWQGRSIAIEIARSSPALWSNSERTLMALAVREGHQHWRPEKVFDLRDS